MMGSHSRDFLELILEKKNLMSNILHPLVKITNKEKFTGREARSVKLCEIDLNH